VRYVHKDRLVAFDVTGDPSPWLVTVKMRKTMAIAKGLIAR